MQKVHSFATAFDYNDSKLNLKDESQRAEVLSHNFLEYNKDEILKEIKILNKLNSKVKNDGYHVALSFSEKDTHLSNANLIAIADAYKKGMGFNDDHLFLLYKHNDGEDHKHTHVHLILHRLYINEDGKVRVVSDSNNYQRSEKLCREIELKYGLETVRSSKEAQDRAPSKDELEMIQRTGKLSDRMLMQERIKVAMSRAHSVTDFINRCKENEIHLIFNQSESTGRVSGITYISKEGFIAKGQKLGNQFKWSNLKEKLNHEQSRDRQAISETNDRTRARFKDVLERSSRGSENQYGQSARTSNSGNEKSSRAVSEDARFISDEYENRSYSDSGRNHNDKEAEQEIEEAVPNKFSTGAGSVISGFTGLLGGFGGDEVDEDEKHRKRRLKR